MRYRKANYTARKILKSPDISTATIDQITQKVKHECQMICKIKPSPSKFRIEAISDLLDLNWNLMIKELRGVAPVFTAIMEAAASTVRNKPDPAILCMAGAVLLKSRCKHMSKIQMVVSSLLYAGHASKKVGHAVSQLAMVDHILFQNSRVPNSCHGRETQVLTAIHNYSRAILSFSYYDDERFMGDLSFS